MYRKMYLPTSAATHAHECIVFTKVFANRSGLRDQSLESRKLTFCDSMHLSRNDGQCLSTEGLHSRSKKRLTELDACKRLNSTEAG